MSYEPEWLAGYDANGDVVLYDGRKIVLPARAAWAVTNLLRPRPRIAAKETIQPHPHTRQDSEFERRRTG